MGRKKKLTAKLLRERIEAYFDSITVREPLMAEKVKLRNDAEGRLVPVKDRWGHDEKEWVRVTTADGQPAEIVRYVQQPSIGALCHFLGISKQTWENYSKQEEFVDSTTRARERVEQYLMSKLEDPKAVRGAIFALEHNFGWKERKEISMDSDTRAAVTAAGMTMEEKLELLGRFGVDLGKEEES